MMEQFEPKVANKYRMALLALGRPWLQSISMFDANVCCSEETVSPTSHLCPDAAHPLCLPHLHAARGPHGPPLPARTTEQHSIPPLPHAHAQRPNSSNRRLWQGGSHCNMRNMPM